VTGHEGLDSEDTRTRLRETALSLFGRQGVQGTSTRDILQAAGLRNPSAISYYFGSKARLVDDLVTELIDEAWPVLQVQVDLAATSTPTIDRWAEVAVDSAIELVSTERGCLLACLWWEYDCFLHPDAFEEFLGTDIPLAVQWQDAVTRVSPELPPAIAVGRNLVVVRTIEWLIARRARRSLMGRARSSIRALDDEAFRTALLDLTLAILTGRNRLGPDDLILD
jgi:AcrR family transcriptional regulator